MKKRLFIIVNCIIAISAALLFTMCGDTTSAPAEPGGPSNIIDLPAGTSTLDLSGGEELKITSPVPLQCNTSPDPSSYPAGSKINPISLSCTLLPGESIEVSFFSESGFIHYDAIVYVDSGVWTPLTTTLSPDEKTLSATIEDHMMKTLSKNILKGTSITLGIKGVINPPSWVTASDGTYNDIIVIEWEDVADATSDYIFRTDKENATWPGDYQYLTHLNPVVDYYNDTPGDMKTYWYVVLSNATFVGMSDPSDPDSGYTAQFSDPPTGVNATDGTYTDHVNVTWVDVPAIEDGYYVYRSDEEYGTYTKITDTLVSGTSYDDDDVILGYKYWYRVTAYFVLNGETEYSDPASGFASDTPGNIYPVLSSDSFLPARGDTSTTFFANVHYYDENDDIPSAIQVYIDGSPYAMDLSSGSAADGTYTYSTTLLEGDHEYYFYCEEENGGSGRLPDTGTFSGPTVSATIINNNPTIVTGYTVSPESGDSDTIFTFQARYYDSDEDPPLTIEVYIDGAPYTLSYFAGLYHYNAYYKAETTLAAGEHTYYYYCTDGLGGSARAPATDFYVGPSVTSASGDSVLSGTVNYTGSEIIGGSQHLVVMVYEVDGENWTFADSQQFTDTQSSYYFSFELSPETYALYAFIDNGGDGDISEGDIFIGYDGIYFLDDIDLIDLTSSNQYVSVLLTDENLYGFFEDFEDGFADDWIESDDRWLVSAGEYRMEGKVTLGAAPPEGYDDLAWSVYDNDLVADFTFSADLDWVQGDQVNSDWGLLFRFDDTLENGYALWVGYDGLGWGWGVDNIYIDGFGDLQGLNMHEEYGFTPGDTVTVECIGAVLTVYRDGAVVESINLSSYGNVHTEGYIGIYGWDDSGSSDENIFSYDNIWLVYHQ